MAFFCCSVHAQALITLASSHPFFLCSDIVWGFAASALSYGGLDIWASSLRTTALCRCDIVLPLGVACHQVACSPPERQGLGWTASDRSHSVARGRTPPVPVLLFTCGVLACTLTPPWGPLVSSASLHIDTVTSTFEILWSSLDIWLHLVHTSFSFAHHRRVSH